MKWRLDWRDKSFATATTVKKGCPNLSKHIKSPPKCYWSVAEIITFVWSQFRSRHIQHKELTENLGACPKCRMMTAMCKGSWLTQNEVTVRLRGCKKIKNKEKYKRRNLIADLWKESNLARWADWWWQSLSPSFHVRSNYPLPLI